MEKNSLWDTIKGKLFIFCRLKISCQVEKLYKFYSENFPGKERVGNEQLNSCFIIFLHIFFLSLFLVKTFFFSFFLSFFLYFLSKLFFFSFSPLQCFFYSFKFLSLLCYIYVTSFSSISYYGNMRLISKTNINSGLHFYWVYNTNGLRQYTRPKSVILIHNQTEGRIRCAGGPAHLPVLYIYIIFFSFSFFIGLFYLSSSSFF